MSSHAILEIALSLTVFLGIGYSTRESGERGLLRYAPNMLVGLLLFLYAVTTGFHQRLPSLFSRIDSGLIILLFLPAVCSLAENGVAVATSWKRAGIWLAAGLGMMAFSISSGYEIVLYNLSVSASGLAVVLFFGFSAFAFHGTRRILLILSASVWAMHNMVDSTAQVSGLILIMGILALFDSGMLRGAGRYSEFGFDSDDLVDAYAHPFLILDLSGKVVFANSEFLRLSGFTKEALKGKEAIGLFDFPDSRRPGAFKREASKEIRCRLKPAGGDDRQVLLTLSDVYRKGRKLQNLLCMITDEEEHDRMQARIKAESRRFASLYDTSRALSTSLEISDVLETIANAAEALTDSDTCTIFTLDRSRQMIRPLFSTEKEFKEQVMDFEFPVGKGLTGVVVQDGKPRIENWDDATVGAVLVPGTSEEEEESLLAVPLLARNEVIGALTLYKLRKEKFSEEQISTLTVFASQASAAIETSRLYMRLKESERIYKNSVNMAADSIFFVDAETGKIRDVNEMGLRTFGYRRSELVSMHIWEMCSRSHMQYGRRLWQKAISDGQGSLSEAICEARDESIIPVSINASRIEAGDVKFIQWVVRDTSEYKNLLDDMQFFRNLISDLGEPILVTEPLGIIRHFNSAFERFFSVKLRKVEGSTINALSVGHRNLAFLDSMRVRLKGNDHLTEEVDFRNEGGGIIRKLVSIIPSYDENSSVRYHIWFFSNPARGRVKETAQSLP
jgi:PAS domain S-box-containing protein